MTTVQIIRSTLARGELLAHPTLWGPFPWQMRVFFLAQRGRCPYCGKLINVHAKRKGPGHKGQQPYSWDHVRPKSRSGHGKPRNKLLAHGVCNTKKGARKPTACEIFFLEVTNEIAGAPQ